MAYNQLSKERKLIRNKIRIILETLFIVCIGCYLTFFIAAFLLDFAVAAMVYQKIGILKYNMNWDLVIEHAKWARIGLPVGILLSAVRFYEIRDYLLH